MLGLILNVDDARLPADSPWRTREEERLQPPVFVLRDGFPVYEVWKWHAHVRRWFVMSRVYDAELAAAGVIFYYGMPQLKAWIAHLEAEARAR